MKRPICSILACAVFFAGCAGREANPIAAYLPGDENRSCTALKAEVAQLQVDMARLLPKTDKGLTNALWATAGVFFIVPFFFMDFKDAEKIEFDAMRQRHNRLLVYAAEKNCDFGEVRAERIPSIEERKAQAKKTKKAAVAKVADSNSTSIDEASASTNQAEVSRRLLYLASHPVSEEVRFAILNEMAAKGMTKEELIASFGEPNQIIKTEKHEQFVYDNRKPKSYYFKGGILEKAE